MQPEQWTEAFNHVQTCKQRYADLVGIPGVSVGFAMHAVIAPLLERYNRGERTDELYEAMMGVE